MAKIEYTLLGEVSADLKGIDFVHGDMVKRLLPQFVGKRLTVTIAPLEYQRSSAQNRWLWGVAYVHIAAWYKETQGTKITKEDVHDYVLQHVLGVGTKEKVILGKTVISNSINKRTSELTVGEFQEFKEALQMHFAEYGLDIPDPRGNNLIDDFIDQ